MPEWFKQDHSILDDGNKAIYAINVFNRSSDLFDVQQDSILVIVLQFSIIEI